MRNSEGKMEKKEVLTSKMLVDYNKGHYNMVDCSDSIKGALHFGNKRSFKSFRPALDYCMLGCIPANFWLLYRALHPDSKITFRALLPEVVYLHLKDNVGTHLELTTKRKDNRGTKRFTGRDISNLKINEIRLEMGPVKINRNIFGHSAKNRIYAKTQIHRAKCMAYEPVYQMEQRRKRVAQGKVKITNIAKRKECSMCGRMTNFRCMGGECGLWACMKPTVNGKRMCMKITHRRWEKAWRKLKRSI